MNDELTPCVACARHVRVVERVCPFCGAAVTATASREVPTPRGVSRAAMLLGASLSLAACPRREQQIAAVYGAPPTPAASRDAAAPPSDAARRNPNAPARPPQDPGSTAEVYGAPPPVAGDGGAAH
ncbi:MAG: hypothetical protein U0325_11380 [Polyangiales bacterium]